jgi:hypothetical protein
VTYYHASRNPDLCATGIKIGKPTSCSIYRKSKHVYVGTLDYINNQYLKYCPKGTYYIYEIDIEHNLEPLLAKGQWRTTSALFPKRIVNNTIVN